MWRHLLKRSGTQARDPDEWRQSLLIILVAEAGAIAGYAVVTPILPLYVGELGVGNERQVALWAGLVVSVYAVPMALMAPVWGKLSDRYGRKIMIERAMFGGGLVFALMGYVRNVQELVVLRLLLGALTDIMTAAVTWVAVSVPRDRVGYALGLLQVAMYVGDSVGPLLGGRCSRYVRVSSHLPTGGSADVIRWLGNPVLRQRASSADPSVSRASIRGTALLIPFITA
jgi:MFS family permease